MAMFDYRGQDVRAQLSEAFYLSINYASNVAPPGWRRLTAAELNIDPSKIDEQGQFTGDGTLDGQALVLGKFVNGALQKIAVAFTATNSAADVEDYPQMVDDSYANAFDYMLDAVRGYAKDHDLTGRDVVVTGYSLGAGAVNNMAAQRTESWGGFFAGADYFAQAVPKITEDARVFNFGFENDVVHRVLGEGILDARFTDANYGSAHDDGPFVTTTDNVVLFNDVYANPGFPVNPFVLENRPEGWAAHTDGSRADYVSVIGSSHWYDYTERDSTVVVSNLSAATRGTTWVEDKQVPTSDHFGSMAFLIGRDSADLLRDGTADDFIDGGKGDDTIRISGGNDSVWGGEGTDTVILAGGLSGSELFRANDGTLFVFDRDAATLDELGSVEIVQLGDEGATYSVGTGALEPGNQDLPDIAYSAFIEDGQTGAQVKGTVGDDVLFGMGGKDELVGGKGSDLLVGGGERDKLVGGAGDDFLFGGAGDDRLIGGNGSDHLSGGVGSDVFDFSDGIRGQDVISDFNMGEQGIDTLRLSGADFVDVDAVFAASYVEDGSMFIQAMGGLIELVGITSLDAGSIVLVDVGVPI